MVILLATLMVLLTYGAVVGSIALYVQFGWRGAIAGVASWMLLVFIVEMATGVVFFTYAEFVPEQQRGDA